MKLGGLDLGPTPPPRPVPDPTRLDMAHCGSCKITYPICDRCGLGFHLDPRGMVEVPPPYGSLDSRRPLALCGPCHRDLIRTVFRWAGRPVPDLAAA